MMRKPSVVSKILSSILVSILVSRLHGQSIAPAPSLSAPLSTSANASGSLGAYCSSLAGIQTAIQADAANTSSHVLNITVPADLVQQVSQIAWQYISTEPLPLVAKLVAAGSANGTAANSFYGKSDHLSNENDTTVNSPNHDTLYSQAFLDLSQGPQIISVPQINDPRRYYIVPLLDAYTNYYGGPGSIRNSSSGQYLVVGPGSPSNATYGNFTSDRIFRSPTAINWVIARILVLNDSDTATAYALSQQLSITPCNQTGNAANTSSAAVTLSKAVNGSGYAPYTSSIAYLNGFQKQPTQWFNVSAQFVATDPPGNQSASSAAVLTSLSQNASAAQGNGNTAFQLGQQIAQLCINSSNIASVTTTGWRWKNITGLYGSNYLARAQDALNGIGGLPASEVIYFSTAADSSGQKLDASTGTSYNVSFSIPLPAQAFWSLAIYNATNQLFFQNPISRYSIGGLTSGLIYSGAQNNTLNVYISAQQPAAGTAQYANWLPAPTDAPFTLLLRLYGPTPAVGAGQYAPPPVIASRAIQAAG